MCHPVFIFCLRLDLLSFCAPGSHSISAALSLSLSIVRGHNFRAAAAEATIYEIAADNADNLTRRNGEEEDEVGRVWFGRAILCE